MIMFFVLFELRGAPLKESFDGSVEDMESYNWVKYRQSLPKNLILYNKISNMHFFKNSFFLSIMFSVC